MSSKREPSVAGGFLGAGAAGFLELFLFHPLDTAGKRLIHHRGRNYQPGSTIPEAIWGIRKIVFKEAAGRGIAMEVASLYPAFGYAVMYKMLQRSLQFGTHPIVSRYIQANHGKQIQATFGDTWARTMTAGYAGIVIGFLEVILLPLDALKVKGQTGVNILSQSPSPSTANTSTSSASTISPASSTTSSKGNPKTLMSAISSAATATSSTSPSAGAHAATITLTSSKLHFHSSPTSHQQTTPRLPNPSKPPTNPSPLIQLLQRPAILANLYRGSSWTATRNSVGCFALFGTSTFVKDRVFGLQSAAGTPPPPATLTQNMIASLCGACASIAVAAPLDVVKVRVQAAPLDAPISGWKVVRSLLQTEGVWALSKGVLPKMIASGPKVTFSFTIAQTLTDYLGGGSFKRHH
ncbi:hypothetical protein HDV05_007527 [Chytridiales sp. JEL 0842]|nr:hypothetical protein HDV05_007527 [Chytridiales sp. JEL 0842]